MMSCRHGGPGSVTYNRRLQSAERVISILRRKGHMDLAPLPLVPYVLSVATTVIYRVVIDGQLSSQEALPYISDCCDALEDLSQLWTSAKGIAKLARWLYKHVTSSSSNFLQNNSGVSRSDDSRIDSRSAQSSGTPTSVPKPVTDSTQNPMQEHRVSCSPSAETVNNIPGIELGQGLDGLAFDVFADMETAGFFFDYLNSNYGESEDSRSLA